MPFETRPFLRLADGRLVLWSPRTAIGWITDGFYFRALDAATALGREAAFRTYYGALVEDYVCTVLEETFPERELGSGRVHREQQYRVSQGHRRSPDVAIDYGQDLIFVEVTSGRLSFETRVGGDPARVGKDLTRLITGKAEQLSARIDDYFADRFAIAGVERSNVARVWPVVVTASGLLMSEPLHAYLHQQIGDALQQPRVHGLTVMDLADLEQMCALVEAGHSIPDLLARKAGGYRGLDWRRMVNEDPYLPAEVRFSGMERRSDALWMNAVEDYGWDPEQFRSEQRQRQADEQP